VSVLNIDVPAVRLSDVLRLQTTQVVAVHKNRHAIPFGCHSGWSPCEATVRWMRFGLRLALDAYGFARDGFIRRHVGL
jgi:hypothetical protein